MRIKSYAYAMIVSLGLASAHAYAATSTAIKPTENATGTSLVQNLCPAPETLTKKGQMWYGPDDWQSYSQSFADKITQFNGAQWIGVNYGKIICVYGGSGNITFPIAMEKTVSVLVPMPTGGAWGPNKGGYMNCTSPQVSSCAFKVETKQKLSPDQLFQQLDFFKKSPSNTTNENN